MPSAPTFRGMILSEYPEERTVEKISFSCGTFSQNGLKFVYKKTVLI